jgi:hypothetical protein
MATIFPTPSAMKTTYRLPHGCQVSAVKMWYGTLLEILGEHNQTLYKMAVRFSDNRSRRGTHCIPGAQNDDIVHLGLIIRALQNGCPDTAMRLAQCAHEKPAA